MLLIVFNLRVQKNARYQLVLPLGKLVGAMDEPQAFKRGQFVRWKAGLKGRALPAYNEAAIVREVLSVPVYDACEAARCANSIFGEPLTLILAVVGSDGDLFPAEI